MATTGTKRLAAVVGVVVLLGAWALYATGLVGGADDDAGHPTNAARDPGDPLAVLPGLEGGAAAPGPDDATPEGADRPPLAPGTAVDEGPGGGDETDPDAANGPRPTAGSMAHVPPVRRSPFAPPPPKNKDPNAPRFGPGGPGGGGPTGHWTQFPLAKPPRGTARLAVTVVDQGDVPIEGAEVMIGPPDIAGVEGVSFGDLRKLGMTSADGTFRHDELTAGEVAVAANVGGLLSGRWGLDARAAAAATLESGKTASVTIRLPVHHKDLGNVAGRITGPNGEPLASAQVALGNNVARADRDGRYRLVRAPAGEQTISFSRWGYQTVLAKIEVRADNTVTHDVRLPFKETGGVGIGGQVVGPDDEPIAGATVYLNVPDDHATFRSAVTDADGRFVLRDLPERLTTQAVIVQGSAVPRYGSTSIPFDDGIVDGLEVRIQILSRYVELVLDVRDAGTNEPVRRLSATATPPEGEDRRTGTLWYHEAKGGHSGMVEPGRYHVVIQGLDHEDAELELDIPSEDRFVHEVTLRRVSPDSVDVHLLVELVSSTGETPISRAKIEILDAKGRVLGRFEGRRDDGRYLLPAPSGKRTLAVEAEGFEPFREVLDLDPMVLEVEHVVHLRPR